MHTKNINRNFLLIVFMAFATILPNSIKAQLTVTSNQTATALAQSLVGQGVSISNPTLACDPIANGVYMVVPPNTTNLGIDTGIVLTSGMAATAGANWGVDGAAINLASTATTGGADADLFILSGGVTLNACVLEFDFVPLGDSIKFDYVFGSEEYDGFTCSFNDVFGFFISGPGITGPFTNNAKNIALVPGTASCPVGVKTINCMNLNCACSIGGTLAQCNAAPGCNGLSPYNTFFNCNQTGTSVTYRGLTTVLTAETEVQPCSTYHLKLAVADALDQILDSGVFIKAGSLTSNSISFQPLSALNTPQPYVVEGCAAGLIKISRPVATPNPYPVNYGLGGNAINGVDYNTLSGTVTIPANDTVVYINISGIGDNIAEGTESLIIYQYAPCTTSIVDSVEILISDNYIANIASSDTTICAEDSVFIQVNGDDSLTYTWTPIAGVSNPTIKEPTVSPNVTTTYNVAMAYPQAGCPVLNDSITVTMKQPPLINIGNDSIICQNLSIAFNPTISPAQQYTYTWSGSGAQFLSSTSIINPVGTFTQQGVFDLILNADPGAAGCTGMDTITIEVVPDDIVMLTPDTTICKGSFVPIRVDGHPYFNYQWSPSTFLDNPTIEDPTSTPDSSISYTVTANFSGCNPMSKTINISVEPIPIIEAGANREMCDYDTIQLQATVVPANYPNYTYTWTPGTDLIGANTSNPVFTGRNQTFLQLIVNTPIGCSDTDIVNITVNPVEFSFTSPSETVLCPRDSVQFSSNGAISYYWTPSLYLNNDSIGDPISSAIVPIEYTIYGTNAKGCVDTDKVVINIAPQTVIDAGEDVTIYPGESHQIYTKGNASLFSWFPPYALDNTTVSDPVATPAVSTMYFVTGQTENGCESKDSIYIRVSPETLLDLPNAFTPGSGTSINDLLKIKKRGIATLNYFRIFNRWGELIWQTTDIEEGWNGRYKGEPQPMGAYVFMIEAKTSTGRIFNKQGTVTLIR